MSLTIPPSQLSAVALFQEGTEKQRQAHKEKEKDKVGTLRGGNSGALVNGEVMGKCHRRSLLRFLGVEEPKSTDSYNFFDAGYASEWTWENKLKESWPGKILCEEDIPIKWQVPDTNVWVTGRPDMVLCAPIPEGIQQLLDSGDFEWKGGKGPEPKPVLGLELKAILAINSAVGVALENQPKTDHLIQAAHYSWQMGIPWVLVYSWNVQGDLPYWAKKRFDVAKLTPGKREFRLGWDEGCLYYVTDRGKRVDTVITQDSIRDYYRLVADMADKKDVYRRPADKDVDGQPARWSQCGYCPFKDVCDSYEGADFDRWVDEARRVSEQGD